MTPQEKLLLKGKIAPLSAQNQVFKALLGLPPQPIILNTLPEPILIQPALLPYLHALQMHADNTEKLLKLLEEIVSKS